MSMLSIPPQPVRANIARARAQLHRNNIPQTMLALALALRDIVKVQLTSAALFELEVHISEIRREMVNHKDLAPIFVGRGVEVKRRFAYKRGRELALANVLEGLAAMFHEQTAAEETARQNAREQRKRELLENGIRQLHEGNLPRGKAYLRRLADEYGEETDLLTLVGNHLSSAGLHYEAAEIYEEAIARFPRDAAAYRGAAMSWMEAQEYAKAEDIFLRILRTFGGHASTYGKMARLYYAWGRRALLEEALANALSKDPGQTDALEVEELLHQQARARMLAVQERRQLQR